MKERKKYNFQTDFEVIDKKNIDDTRFTKVKIWLMHTGYNENKNLYFHKAVVDNAIPTLNNIPILSNIEFNTNSLKDDFTDHEVSIGQNGELIKETSVIGVIPETNNAHYETRIDNEGVNREYLVVEGLLWNSRAEKDIDILERDDGKKSQSMELSPNMDIVVGEDDVYYVLSMAFDGACILGDHVEPAMSGSTLELFSESDTDRIAKEIKQKITMYNSKEGGTELAEDKKKKLEEEKDKKEKEDKSKEETKEETSEDTEETSEDTSEKKKEVKEDKEEKEDKKDEDEKEKEDFSESEKKEDVIDGDTETEDVVEEVAVAEEPQETDESPKAKMPSDFQKEIDSLKKELEELRNFKQEVIEAENKIKKEAIFSKYKAISGLEDYKKIKEQMDNFTVDELDRELALVFANNADKINFSTRDDKEDDGTFLFSDMASGSKEENSRYGGLLEKYGIK